MTDPPAARILLVEDDEVGGTLLVELLGSLGDVHWTTSAEQALEIAEGRDWDLMVSDIDLPGIDGTRAGAPRQARAGRSSPR